MQEKGIEIGFGSDFLNISLPVCLIIDVDDQCVILQIY